MQTRNVVLSDHLAQFIDDGVESGRFSEASDVVEEALHLLEKRHQDDDEAKREWLRAAAKEGDSTKSIVAKGFASSRRTR